MKHLLVTLFTIGLLFQTWTSFATAIIVYFGSDFIVIAVDGKRHYADIFSKDSVVSDSICRIREVTGVYYSLTGITGSENSRFQPRLIIDSCLNKYSFDNSLEIVKTKPINIFQELANKSDYLNSLYKTLEEKIGMYIVQIILVNNNPPILKADLIEIIILNENGRPKVIRRIIKYPLEQNLNTALQLGYKLPGLSERIKSIDEKNVWKNWKILNKEIIQISKSHPNAVSECINVVEIKVNSANWIQNMTCK